jgi:hypothetical protein
LRARGPELLALMRYGPAPTGSAAGAGGWKLPDMLRSQTIIVYVCWSLAWVPFFSQGIVPLIFK